MNLREIQNPYDFSHPVSDPQLFFGRTKELGEIRYYLDQARKSTRPVSLAIMGDRASGKTSLLNIIEIESAERGLFPVRIDLDEADMEDQLSFFYKVFNSLIAKTFDAGKFGGRSGRVFSAYLDMVSAYVTPNDLEFAPWTFPVQYARARAHGRVGVVLDDAAFKDDLVKVSNELNKVIVFIFDECNVFRKDKFVLQKLRNIFMNIPNFMLVFSGTRELFPIMDEVFSPIIRQFKRIEVGAFRKVQDTYSCVIVPLNKAGIRQRDRHKLISTNEIIPDIHGLSGGRPYEVQLICHMLMRRCQMGFAKRFLLNIGVLEEVRSELATGQDISDRPIIVAAKGLNRAGLEAMAIVCGCRDQAKFDDMWGIEFVLRGETKWTKAVLTEQKDLLVSLGILAENEPFIKFQGDQFDRIYLKYVARQKQVTLSIWNAEFEGLFWGRLEKHLSTRWKQMSRLGLLNAGGVYEDTAMIVRHFDASGAVDESIASSIVAEDILHHVLLPTAAPEYAIVDCRLEVYGQQSQYWLLVALTGSNDNYMGRLEVELEEMSSRAAQVGWRFVFEVFGFKRPDRLNLVRRLSQFGDEVFQARTVAVLGSALVDAYVDMKDTRLAQSYVDCLVELPERIRTGEANNVGYIAMTRGDYDLAEKLFNDVLSSNEPQNGRMLSLYNLGTCLAMQGKTADARRRFDQIQNEHDDDGSEAGCLFVISPREPEQGWQETFDIKDIRSHAKDAVAYCDAKLGNA